jgi:hypothetical protein
MLLIEFRTFFSRSENYPRGLRRAVGLGWGEARLTNLAQATWHQTSPLTVTNLVKVGDWPKLLQLHQAPQEQRPFFFYLHKSVLLFPSYFNGIYTRGYMRAMTSFGFY